MLAKDRFNRSDNFIERQPKGCLTQWSVEIGLAHRTKRDIIGGPAKHVGGDIGECLTCFHPVKGGLRRCGIVKNHLPDFPCFRGGEFIKARVIGGGDIRIADLHLGSKHVW